tara:strand:+ start:2816 stop:3214 length:399 start_codon:yes stop_codon:yes gene_type:complete
MNEFNNLEILPINFRHEKVFLKDNNLQDWQSIRDLSDLDINLLLKKKSLCTESRLKKIRAIAIFITELKLTPYQAYILLHSGIGSLKTLSNQNPDSLKQKIGRLERRMKTRTQLEISQKLLKEWIFKSKRLY